MPVAWLTPWTANVCTLSVQVAGAAPIVAFSVIELTYSRQSRGNNRERLNIPLGHACSPERAHVRINDCLAKSSNIFYRFHVRVIVRLSGRLGPGRSELHPGDRRCVLRTPRQRM